ncbi:MULTISPECIES: SMC-Scp complex subunit ScpB [Enterococcus]|uniref:Segregation and condensation protein B n=2 Tax=root TaxID=1 RepID=A0A179EP79_ENTTH|nr:MULTISPECIES: SMC-Scp complex subunit ScpB [Enterococcus]ASZ07154.1 SMC-Scp complex subunit ScpB [Enterococcus thailandicus]MDA3965470.1 SMC-Scp complex subunit ScpB [Enterococcus thailandicus]MDK4352556.1 SMC-Scp complex subunit ScpB [Enterococcus thailandicus]MDT2735155.1 SMC-Scp complex subunit ScpB [Enterococcus thailandicus]MDT2752796.1 SMC-Scp complex subunit ScpB [Enterococcus thailandicus]
MTKLSELEAILFVAGEAGIGSEELSYLLNVDKQELAELILALEKKYQATLDSALHIFETEDHFVLTTKKELAPLLKKYAQGSSNTLSQAAVETLAIIAYKQPITRTEIEQIRGVQASGPVQRLVAHKLIEEKGRVEGPGRPILYGTTGYFLDYFGLKDLTELPDTQELENALKDDESLDLFFDGVSEGEKM